MKTIATLILFALTSPAGADDIARHSRDGLGDIPGTHLRVFACVHDVCWQVNDVACPTPDNDVCAFIEGKRNR